MVQPLPEHLRRFATPTPVLDHGHVRLVEVMGDDAATIDMARISIADQSTWKSSDVTLLRHLTRLLHTSPSEGCVIKLHLKMPIFVARQWFRHRTHSANEVSARYSELPEEFYVPELDRIQAQSTTNKQGSEKGILDEDTRYRIRSDHQDAGEDAFATYQKHLDLGESRELARISLPLSTYTEFYWVQNLHNLLHLITLRDDPHAQYEIQVYARAIGDILRAWVPHLWRAFQDYKVRSMRFSRMELEALQKSLSGLDTEAVVAGSCLMGRESREFAAKLKRLLTEDWTERLDDPQVDPPRDQADQEN